MNNQARIYDVAIIGGGIIGASIARELSKLSLKTVLLEEREDLARGASGANSGIIHAGYDPHPGSLMARYNVKGNAMYPALCEELHIPFKPVGSFVLAFDETDGELLETLLKRGETNGVPGLKMLSGEEVRQMEPAVSESVTAALYAPTAGIISPYEATIALAENAALNGVEFLLEAGVTGISREEDTFVLTTAKEIVKAKRIINCAGACADRVSQMAGGESFSVQQRKGEYTLYDRNLGGFVNHVIFQTPNEAGKGVLVTPTAEGNLLLGPSSDALLTEGDTATTTEGQQKIFALGKKSCPTLPGAGAITSFAGIRVVVGEDFVIGPSEKVPGLMQVAGICSPGLTSAPAIAEDVATWVQQELNAAPKSDWKAGREAAPCMRELSWKERTQVCQQNADYGKIVCRCETVTEGEIRRALRSSVPVYTLDGVKRRCRAGMGRCQGSFCTPRVMEIIAEEAKLAGVEGFDFNSVRKAGAGTEIVRGRLKGTEA